MNSKQNEKGMTHVEVIEASIGACKRWQILIFLLVFLVNMPLAMQELSITLLAPPVHFECSNPDIDDPCNEECSSLEYNTSVFDQTIVMQWDLVCDRQWLENFAQTILMAGILVGNFIFGFFADRYGRRKPLVIAIIMEVLSGVGIAFTKSLWLFLLLRFLVAVAAGGTLCTAFVIIVEIIGKKYRSTFGILFQMSYYAGHALLGLVGYFLRDWRYIQLTISLPVILLLSYIWLLPESPLWLLTVGRLEEAIAVMEKAAKCNGMPVENVRPNVMSKVEDTTYLKSNILDLFRNSNVRIKTFIICFNWAVLGLSFFGVAQYIGQMGGNIFINISFSGLIQIPGNVIIIYLIQKYGRKITVLITYLLCSISCLLITVVPPEPKWVLSLLGCISMMAISLSFATMFVWSGELYPTVVRNVGMGSSAMCAKIGSMLAPFLDHAGIMKCWIPPLVFGIAPLVAILTCLRLPETVNTKMPDTIEEAEQIGKHTGRN